jgi:amidohydrolase
VDVAAVVVGAVNALRANPRVSHSAKVTQLYTTNKAVNTIPDCVHIALDLRAQTNEVMALLLDKVAHAIQQVAQSLGAVAEVDPPSGTPAAEYDPTLVATARAAIMERAETVLPSIDTPGGEDFHFYKQILNVKTCYVGIGADLKPGLHHPRMTFDLDALSIGRDILVGIAKRRLSAS